MFLVRAAGGGGRSAMPAVVPLLMASTKSALKPFGASREVEDLIDQTSRS
jgi:hypothetical protein